MKHLVCPGWHRDPIGAAVSIAENRASKVRLLLTQDAPDLALRCADSLLDDVLEFIGARKLSPTTRELLEHIAWKAREEAQPA